MRSNSSSEDKRRNDETTEPRNALPIIPEGILTGANVENVEPVEEGQEERPLTIL